MDIEKAKELCGEHEILSETVRIIKNAAIDHKWVKIVTPNGESYLSDVQIRNVLDSSIDRITGIEKELEKV